MPTDKLVLPTTITYGDVDHREVILLPRLFKLLQEVAITHANQYGTGSGAIFSRGETWMLNRIAVALERYPRYEDAVRFETWSTGIKGFRGYRDFRLYDAQERCILRGSSVWLYVSVASKSIVRVPRDVVESFPVGPEPAAYPDLDKMEFATVAAEAPRVPVSLRYSDFDVNEHVNNAAYFELVQTALAQAGAVTHPREIRLKYVKGIPAGTASVDVAVAPGADALTSLAISTGDVLFAQGETRGTVG